MGLQPSTAALFVVTAAVWIDDSAGWTKAIVTASLAVCIVIDVIRARRQAKAEH